MNNHTGNQMKIASRKKKLMRKLFCQTTEDKLRQSLIREKDREIKMMLDNIPLAVVVCDNKWNATRVNKLFAKVFHISNDDLFHFDYPGFKMTKLHYIHPPEFDIFEHVYRAEVSIELDGKEEIFLLAEQEILNHKGVSTGHYCFFRNITIQHEHEKAMFDFANTDPLTGLNNRRYFFEYINQHRNAILTILFMDMDNFKRVNDTHGHAVGDTVLKTTADSITDMFPGCLVARLGGDEFAVIADSQLAQEELNRRSVKLQSIIEETFMHLNVGLSISTGIAHTDGNIENIDTFINKSDQMMYEQKAAKKGTVR